MNDQIIKDLINIANSLDDKYMFDESDVITKIAKQISIHNTKYAANPLGKFQKDFMQKTLKNTINNEMLNANQRDNQFLLKTLGGAAAATGIGALGLSQIPNNPPAISNTATTGVPTAELPANTNLFSSLTPKPQTAPLPNNAADITLELMMLLATMQEDNKVLFSPYKEDINKLINNVTFVLREYQQLSKTANSKFSRIILSQNFGDEVEEPNVEDKAFGEGVPKENYSSEVQSVLNQLELYVNSNEEQKINALMNIDNNIYKHGPQFIQQLIQSDNNHVLDKYAQAVNTVLNAQPRSIKENYALSTLKQIIQEFSPNLKSLLHGKTLSTDQLLSGQYLNAPYEDKAFSDDGINYKETAQNKTESQQLTNIYTAMANKFKYYYDDLNNIFKTLPNNNNLKQHFQLILINIKSGEEYFERIVKEKQFPQLVNPEKISSNATVGTSPGSQIK